MQGKLKYIRGDRRQFDGEIYYISGFSSVKPAAKDPKFIKRIVPGYDSTGKVKGYLVYRRKKKVRR